MTEAAKPLDALRDSWVEAANTLESARGLSASEQIHNEGAAATLRRHAKQLDEALAAHAEAAPRQRPSFDLNETYGTWHTGPDALPRTPIGAPQDAREAAQEILKPHWPVVHNMEENAAREREVDRIVAVMARAALKGARK